MTRSRLAVMISMVVVALGAMAALGALYLDPARAAVGPLPAEGLMLPADARFLIGVDVKHLTASPFYQRYARRGESGHPQAFAEIEEKTGLNPERDVRQVVIAGLSGSGPESTVALVLGRFDRAKLSHAIETEKKDKVTWKKLDGTMEYLYKEEGKGTVAVTFLDDHSLLLGAPAVVEATITSRSQGATTLRSNAALMGLLERVKPGSTFWLVGDQTLLANLPRTMPAPGFGPNAKAAGSSLSLPALKSLIITGDLEPQVALAITGDTTDEAAARNLADMVRGFVALVTIQASQKPELKQLASAISVTTEASRVLVNARFPYELIDALRPTPPAASPAPLAK
jgi:hypothetical protein